VAGLTGEPAESGEPAEPLGAARLLGPTEIRGLAARLGLQPSKRLGQNFVIDAGTVTRITALAKVGPADVVLEVGPPPTGSLPSRWTGR
jgi:16S rRNA (adenine1518-N6/adenine1519-N6)-dimethyltransferase